jgi:hypothetical protein
MLRRRPERDNRDISPISNHSMNSKERLHHIMSYEYNKDEEARHKMPNMVTQVHSGNLNNDPGKREKVS